MVYVEENDDAKYEKYFDFDCLCDGICFCFNDVPTFVYQNIFAFKLKARGSFKSESQNLRIDLKRKIT